MKKIIALQQSKARAMALQSIHIVRTQHAHIQYALAQSPLQKTCTEEDISLATEIVYGYFRKRISIEYLLQHYLHRIEKLPPPFIRVVELAIYEILYISSIPASTTTFHTVELIKNRYSPSLARVANGLLRAILRHKEKEDDTLTTVNKNNAHILTTSNIQSLTEEKIAQYYSLPYYIWEALVESYREKAHEYAYFFSQRPQQPNTPCAGNPASHVLFEKLTIPQLLKNMPINASLWECCSGIGGKRAVLQNYAFPPTIVSDSSINKVLKQPKEAGTQILCVDATMPPFAHNSINCIIADVPCSGTGTIRKRPDILYHRTQKDIANICTLQKNILTALAPIIKPSGYLIYITCSICRCENEEQIEDFIIQNPNFSLISSYRTTPYNTFNSIACNDIFYGAVLQKNTIS